MIKITSNQFVLKFEILDIIYSNLNPFRCKPDKKI